MEARATINSAAVSRTFLAAVLVLVAMGLAAMAGYAARGAFSGSGAATNSIAVGHAAPGTVLRQDNPAKAPAELPGWMEQELAGKPAAAPIIVDDPNYYDQYLATPAPEPRSTGHRNLSE